MEQLVQSLKDGKMSVTEVPFPVLSSGHILVRNYFSLISAGTEGKTVKDARAGYIGKARARKDEVKKVINTARTIGIMNTYKLVMNKLETPSPLGYCTSGIVIETAPDVTGIRVGDLVACGGSTANHAEVISVPVNLCVKIPDNVDPETASMTTMGAIAMQGVRQAELNLGESCVVIGLGLLGQITLQLLEASGVKCIGVDIDTEQVALTKKLGKNAVERKNELIHEIIERFTGGYGADAIIITAGTTSSDPVDFAGEVARQKAKVVVVGAVPTGFKRQHYFKKELDLRMSCSYGPGRYDVNYEEHGFDYPVGYVRWTENRNMESFLELTSRGKINPAVLITHKFGFNDCMKAYDLILNKDEKYLGITLKYDITKELKKTAVQSHPEEITAPAASPVAGIIGAGSFARNILLPSLEGTCRLKTVVSSKPADSSFAAKRHKIQVAASDPDHIFKDNEINTLLIATRHDSHFEYVVKGMKAGKHVFTEKPLCMNESELFEIRDLHSSSGTLLMTGFNRRFSPIISQLKKNLPESGSIPVAINYRINAGVVPSTHWIHDIKKGGGRIIGEVCHFVDLISFLSGSAISSVSAVAMNDVHSNNDTLAVSFLMQNGSIASLSYFSNGNASVPKEQIEVFYGGSIAIIDDFRSLKITGKNSVSKKLPGQEKGHKEQFVAFMNAIREGKNCPVPFEETYNSMLATFRIAESVRTNGERIAVNHSEN